MSGQLGLILRVALLYPLAGFAAALPFVTWNEVAGTLTIDVNAGAIALAAVIYSGVTGGTFAWSRWIKRLGGAT